MSLDTNQRQNSNTPYNILYIGKEFVIVIFRFADFVWPFKKNVVISPPFL